MQGYVMDSRGKGFAGERELAKELQKYGYTARRGQQYSVKSGDADVVGVPGLHIECKRVERLNIGEALEQSMRDASDDEIPVVMHRKNRQGWKVSLSLSDFMLLWKTFGSPTRHSTCG